MGATILQNLLIALLGTAAFVHVAWLRPRTDIHSSVLSLLGAMVLLAIGQLALSGASSEGVARAGLYVAYLGTCALSPSWLWFAARFTRSEFAERRPGLALAAAVPTTLALLALLTNDGHRLFAHSLDRAALQQGAQVWAGPVYWLSLAWQLLVIMAGIAMFVGYAMRLGPSRQRLHAHAMVLAGAVTVAATLARHFHLIPFDVNPIPLASGLALAATTLIAIRYRLSDVLPLARRDVIEALPDAVVLADVDGHILDLNPAAARLLLLPARALEPGLALARTLARLAPDEQMAATERMLEDTLASDQPVAIPLRTRNQRDIEIHSDTVRRDAAPSGSYVLIRDVTETRRYERMLRESQQRVIVGGLAAGLAHEVNNPLAFVASNLQQIHRISTFDPSELEPFEKRRAEELSELAEVVAETIDGVARITEIVGRIIRPGTASEEEFVRLDLGHVIRDAVRLIELHGQYPTCPQVVPVGELPAIEGCPERLSQALLNLLLNAQQACQALPDSAVSVETRAEAGGVAVRIGIRSDSGGHWPGARPEIASNDPNAEAELSAAYEIVREHGGSLEASSGPSTFFVMRLPAS